MDFTELSSPNIGAVIPGRSPATSMSYHADGKVLFVASEGDSRLQVIDCVNGKAKQPALRLEREQIHLVEATHHEMCVLFTGKGSAAQPAGQRHAVHYLSVYDNKLLRKFRGHSDRITSLSMCPADDSFLSSSSDRTCRLWDARQAGGLAELKLPSETAPGSPPIARYDSTGLVFAVSAGMATGDGQYLHLYDARNYGAGAFAELKILRSDLEAALAAHAAASGISSDRASTLSTGAWTSLTFNQSGSQILAGARHSVSFLLDGFDGTVQKVMVGSNYNARQPNRPAATAITADDRTVLMGNDDGSITCWNVDTGTMMKRLEGHTGPVGCLAANPKYAQLASCCNNVALWIW